MKTARRDHDADGELREKGLAELSHVVIRVWINGEGKKSALRRRVGPDSRGKWRRGAVLVHGVSAV